MHSADVICDSISPYGVRLTTFVVTFPRIVLAEFNTHRMISRNSASSRAIPVEKMIKMVEESPYIPTHWGKNQKGMQAEEEVPAIERAQAQDTWLRARDAAVSHARSLLDLGIHKQITNRLLEPFMWHTVIATGTEWSNFFNLRDHKDAHPEIRKAAQLMRSALKASTPRPLIHGQWHVPFVDISDLMFNGEMLSKAFPDTNPSNVTVSQLWEVLRKVSVARCAAVSYLRHEEKDFSKNLATCERMLSQGHMAPFEHVARPMDLTEIESWLGGGYPRKVTHSWAGNFRGWVQYRKTIPGEWDVFAEDPTPESQK